VRVVLDTNIFISGIFWKGTPHRVLEAWMSDKFELVVSEDVLMEYSRILKDFEAKKKGTDGIAKSWILFIAKNSTLLKVKKKVKVCRDPFDDMFLSLAVAANAKFIVSGDNDLLDMKEFMNVKILNAGSFLKELE
jgi:putative PIN family toxin of toxin-antitoxin system